MFTGVRRSATPGLLVLIGALSATGASAAAESAVAQVKAVYGEVLLAEYFGPASAVCSELTASGVRSFTAGGASSCTKAFDQQQHVLRHKTKGVDNSGFTPTQWRQRVASVLAHLTVTVHGSNASAIGPSGIPGRTTLVKLNGRWLFSSYPPSVQP